MPNTRVFDTEFLENELEWPYGAVYTEFQHSGRWAERWKGVFQFEGKFWQVSYEVPSTEMQEGQGMWNDEETVEAIEVEDRDVIVKKWLPVD